MEQNVKTIAMTLVVVLQGLRAQEQKLRLDDVSLRSLQGVSEFAVIIDYSDLPESLQAAKSLIEADVQNRLAASPKLRHAIVTPSSKRLPSGSLWVSIRAKCGNATMCATMVSVSFQQTVRSLVNEKAHFPAPTWMRQDLFVRVEPEVVPATRETLSALVDLFAADFIRANP